MPKPKPALIFAELIRGAKLNLVNSFLFCIFAIPITKQTSKTVRLLSLYAGYFASVCYLLVTRFDYNALRIRFLSPPPLPPYTTGSQRLARVSSLLICLFLYASDYIWYLMKTNLSVCASAIFVSY